MSLKNLLPPGTFEELKAEAGLTEKEGPLTKAPLTVKCPHCGKLTSFGNDNPHRPFCSRSCRLIDLGEWANERRGIPCEAPATPFLQGGER